MIVLRRVLLVIACLVPLITLVHKDDLRRWDVNRCAMVAPDEFSYLLTAEAILRSGQISTQQTLGIDTFYPPGLPLILAAWGAIWGLTPFAVHMLNALLLCAATGVVYLFSRRLLALVERTQHRRLTWNADTHGWLALLIAWIFATNWHVLESALYVFSEPAFMLATFAWLALGLKWQQWHLSYRKTLAVALLAIAAWSIRGAGIVCIAVTVLYPCAAVLQSLMKREAVTKRVGPIALILALAIGYQAIITLASPNKSLASADAASHGYPAQLLNGITDRGSLKFSEPRDWPTLAWHVTDLGMSHVNDFAASFVPWYRDPPDMMIRIYIGKLLGAIALLGFIAHLFRRNPATRFLDAYILCYFALYLLWPFNMARFWSPILPVMLVYLVDGIRSLGKMREGVTAPRLAGTVLTLLLVLASIELWTQLGNYQRRVNRVSDSLARAAASVVKASPDAGLTTVVVAGKDEHFLFAWYLPRVPGGHAGYVPLSPKGRDRAEQLLLRGMEEIEKDPSKRLFALDYFQQANYPAVFENMRRLEPEKVARFELRRLFQSEIITTAWEIRPRGAAKSQPLIP